MVKTLIKAVVFGMFFFQELGYDEQSCKSFTDTKVGLCTGESFGDGFL